MPDRRNCEGHMCLSICVAVSRYGGGVAVFLSIIDIDIHELRGKL